jgi:glycosyltransferase involved in cell wall biosynthesis
MALPGNPAGAEPDVTILVTCYQQAAFVGEAIASALAQTVPVVIRVFDDGSTDGSAEVAKSHGVSVVELPHRGALRTFRAAVDSVSTPYFLILAGDDRLPSNYVEATRRAMAPDIAIAYTPIRFFGVVAGRQGAPRFSGVRLRWANYIHGTSLVRTTAYRAAGGFDPGFEHAQEDWALWVAIVSAGWSAVPVRDTWLDYRRHAVPSRSTAGVRPVRRYRWRIARANARAYGLGGFAILACFEAAGVVRDLWRSLRGLR